MPEIVFLRSKEPLVVKVARQLLTFSHSSPPDFHDIAVILPTAGAGRRLREVMARISGTSGMLPPQLFTSMSFLSSLLEGQIATPMDSMLAWQHVIPESGEFPELLGGFDNLDDGAARLRVAQSLQELSSLLAEAGLNPSSPDVASACSLEADRWSDLAALHERYLRLLATHKLKDRNESVMEIVRAGIIPKSIRHLVVACVPDLVLLMQRYLENAAKTGMKVTLLVDAPEENAVYDEWGRPDLEWQAGTELPIPMEDVVVSSDAASEAALAINALAENGIFKTGLVAADSAAVPLVESAVQQQGLEVYNPAGISLSHFEPAKIVSLWSRFCRDPRVVHLRGLLELPDFLTFLSRKAGLSALSVFLALDYIQTSRLLENLDDAGRFFKIGVDLDHGRDQEMFLAAAKMVKTIVSLRDKYSVKENPGIITNFLKEIYQDGTQSAATPEAQAFVLLSGLIKDISTSPIPVSEAETYWELLRIQVATIMVPSRHQGNEVEINGWLEAPWIEQPHIIITGCVEGKLPSGIQGHPFLPDSVRGEVGLVTNNGRFARDLFLVRGLLFSRPKGSIKFLFPRMGADSEPARPSRIFFRCPDNDLSGRINRAFSNPSPFYVSVPHCISWELEVPRHKPLSKVSVTAFRDYLACPVRFYFKHLAKMQAFDPDKIEMDASDFGVILHKVVENFAKNPEVMDSAKVEDISAWLSGELDRLMSYFYGNRITLPLQIQMEALRARLGAFASLQARERKAGWKIVKAEYRFRDETAGVLGGMRIAASLDRIEVRESTGERRILDYKTFARPKTPEKTHFTVPGRSVEIPEVRTSWNGKDRDWADLQLPLYRWLARQAWPDDPNPPQVGYILLPARLEESKIVLFDLDEATCESALSCAEALAIRMQKGIYWPPASRPPEWDDFSDIFVDGNPMEIFSESSRRFLMGEEK